MSSSEDDFADISNCVDPKDFTPPSSTSISSINPSQGSKLSLNPSPESQTHLNVNPFTNSKPLFDLNKESGTQCHVKIKVDFFNEKGEKITSRTSSNTEIINIISSMMRSKDESHKHSTINKLVHSEEFGQDISNCVLNKLSKSFSTFLSSQDCPLRSKGFFKDEQKILDLDMDLLMDQCNSICPDVFEAVTRILLGSGHERMKQRLFTVIIIGAYTRNQQINLPQKLIGGYLKRKNCSKAGLELLQRCGLSLVSKTVSRDEDIIGTNFMVDVEIRKAEIEEWSKRRTILENLVTFEQKNETGSELKLEFMEDDFIPKILDIGEKYTFL